MALSLPERLKRIKTLIFGCKEWFKDNGLFLAAALLYRLWLSVEVDFLRYPWEIEGDGGDVSELDRRQVEQILMNDLVEELKSLVYEEGRDRILREYRVRSDEEEEFLNARYNRLLVELAAVMYQWRLSTEGAAALEDYLEKRRTGGAGLWDIWSALTRLSGAVLSIWRDSLQFSQHMAVEEEDEQAEFGEKVLRWLVERAPFDEVPDDYGFVFKYFRAIREWAERPDAPSNFYEAIYRDIESLRVPVKGFLRRKLEDPPKIEVGESFPTSEVPKEDLVRQLVGQVARSINLGFVGLKIGAAFFNFPSIGFGFYMLAVDALTAEGHRVLEELGRSSLLKGDVEEEMTGEGEETDEGKWKPFEEGMEYFRFGDTHVFTFTSSSLYNSFLSQFVDKVTDVVFGYIEGCLVHMPSEESRYFCFRGLSQDLGIDPLSKRPESILDWGRDTLGLFDELVKWIDEQGLKGEERRKLWNGVMDFLRNFYDRQREAGGIHGDVVWQHVENWINEATEILKRWEHLKKPPPKDSEMGKKFYNDVGKLLSITETKLLSALHAGGGVLTLLTAGGRPEDLFRLIGVREGVLPSRASRRPHRTGDKKLLQKWLIIAAAIFSKDKLLRRI